MKIKWNKVTWYSKLLAIGLFVLTFYVGFQLGKEKQDIDKTNSSVKIPQTQTVKKGTTITIKSENIKRENFSGSMPVISGPSGSVIVSGANTYIKNRITEFESQANIDVPDMHAKFGKDSPTANYTLDLEATYEKGDRTESLIISDYAYTGGANGNSLYKVFTSSIATGKILNLGGVIKKEKQNAFTELVKKRLYDWRPADSEAPVVFEDAVKDLKFTSFTNWSMNDNGITIYFDKYQIAPGVLGAVAWPLTFANIKDFLNPTY